MMGARKVSAVLAQRDSTEKTSKFGLNELVAWDEN
jgi:hypothetical protein